MFVVRSTDRVLRSLPQRVCDMDPAYSEQLWLLWGKRSREDVEIQFLYDFVL